MINIGLLYVRWETHSRHYNATLTSTVPAQRLHIGLFVEESLLCVVDGEAEVADEEEEELVGELGVNDSVADADVVSNAKE